MNKEGDFLTFIKEIVPQSTYTKSLYTINQRYRIIFINDKVYYIANNETPENIRIYSEQVENGKITEDPLSLEKIRKIKKTCSIWMPVHVDEYFVNIREVRKEKIIKIKKKFK